eukprot:gene1371-2644_t
MWRPNVFLFFVSFICVLGDDNSGTFYKDHHFSESTFLVVLNPGEKYLFISLNALGLANRLRIMASMYAMARRTDRTLFVVWNSSPDCTIAFDELFEAVPQSNFVKLAFNTGVIVLSSDIQDENSYSAFIRSNILNSTTTLNFTRKDVYVQGFLMPTSVFSDPLIDFVAVWTLGIHSPANMSCVDYMYTKSLFYRSLRATPNIRQIVDELRLSIFPGNVVVGLHIRINDDRHDWNVVPPLSSRDSSHSLSFDTASPLHSFDYAVNSILTTHPSYRIFLASNSNDIKRYFVSKHGKDKILTIDSLHASSSSRSVRQGMEFALADFLLLGETVVVLHTRGSSFAREAASMHMRPVIDVSVDPKNGSPIFFYTNDLTLPHCGSHEFTAVSLLTSPHQHQRLPADSGTVEAVLDCYQEDIHRRMCTTSVPYRPCQRKGQSWSIGRLYCYDYDVDVQTKDDDDIMHLLLDTNGYGAFIGEARALKFFRQNRYQGMKGRMKTQWWFQMFNRVAQGRLTLARPICFHDTPAFRTIVHRTLILGLVRFRNNHIRDLQYLRGVDSNRSEISRQNRRKASIHDCASVVSEIDPGVYICEQFQSFRLLLKIPEQQVFARDLFCLAIA